jgi:hypothetical protein
MLLSNRLTSSNHHTNNHHNFAIRAAIRKCSRPCNIRACKEWVKVILHKDGACINLIRALNNSCNPIPLALNLALRLGRASSHQDLEIIGEAGPGSPNDSIHHDLNIQNFTSYDNN